MVEFGDFWWRSACFSRLALSEAVGLAVHLEDMDVVGQAVEKRAGQAFFTECGGPLVKWQVGRDDGGAALVALADEFEEKLRARLRERNEAEFVDDEGKLKRLRRGPATQQRFSQQNL